MKLISTIVIAALVAANALAAGQIYNRDVATAAAIQYSKMASLATSMACETNGSGVVTTDPSTTATEVGYVHGVTSALQTQLNGKQASISNLTCATHQWMSSFASPTLACSQPGFSDLSGQLGTGQLPNLNASVILGNNSGSPAITAQLTPAQVMAMLPAFVGDSGSGGTLGAVPAPSAGDAAAGKVLGAGGGWVVQSSISSASYNALNLGLSASVASNALTIALKQSDGATDPTSGNPVNIGLRSSTSTNGSYNQRSVTAALSITVPSGTTIGTQNALAAYVYVYAMDNAGTEVLAVSLGSGFDNGSVQSSTAISGGSSSTTLYSTAAHSSLPVRLIGRVNITETTAGTWASGATEVSLLPFSRDSVSSNTSGQERIERAFITNSGSAAISSQSGSWLSSVNRSASGHVQIKPATGIFSATPSCTISPSRGGAGYAFIFPTDGASSPTNISFVTDDNTGSAVDSDFNVICMGPH